ALVELVQLYLMQGQLRKAVVVDTMAIRLQPDAEGTAKAFADVGMILWSMGQPDGGLKSLDKALFLHPDLPEALLYRGIILFAGLRDMRAAAETFERYLEVAPPDANTGRVRAMLDAARQGSATRYTTRAQRSPQRHYTDRAVGVRHPRVGRTVRRDELRGLDRPHAGARGDGEKATRHQDSIERHVPQTLVPRGAACQGGVRPPTNDTGVATTAT